MAEVKEQGSGNNDTVINKEEMKKMLLDNKIDKIEAQKIIKFIKNSITPLPEELQKIVANLEAIKREALTLEDNTKNELLNIVVDVEKNNSKYGFNNLEKNYENTEATKEFLYIVGNYIDTQLVGNFSNIEKDNIKLIMLSEIENKISASGIVGGITSKIIDPLQKLFFNFNNKEKSSEDKVKEMSAIKDEFASFLDNLGLKTIQADIDSKIAKINEGKKKNERFTDTKKIVDSLDIKELKGLTSDKIFEKVNSKTSELSSKLEGIRGSGEGLKKVIESTGFGDTINGFLKGLAEGEGFFATIMKFILGALFGKEFLNEGLAKINKSTKQLEEFSKTSEFPLKGIVKPENLKDLDPKKLEKFYKFLDSKKIDYSTDTFWEELLTGKSKNEEIKKLYELLKNKDGKILLKDDNLDGFLNKLNGLEDVKTKQNKEKLKKDAEKANNIANASKKASLVTGFTQVETQKVETPKTETPKTETAQAETPKVETPKVETPKVETPKVETPKVETPKVETPKVETPKVETPKVETANKLSKLQNNLSATMLSDFFSENFNLDNYNDLKLGNNLSISEYRSSFVKAYNDDKFNITFEGINTFGELLEKGMLVQKKIELITDRVNYINNLNLETLKKDLKFNNGIFELNNGIKYKYKINILDNSLSVKEEPKIQSIDLSNNKINVSGIIEGSFWGFKGEKDLSKKPIKIESELYKSIMSGIKGDLDVNILIEDGKGEIVLEKV